MRTFGLLIAATIFLGLPEAEANCKIYSGSGYNQAGWVEGSKVYSGSGYTQVGWFDGTKIYSGTGYTQVGWADGCMRMSTAAGALLLL